MKMDLFVEDEAAGRSVKHCCDMFQVSRAAYYQRKTQTPSARAVADGELVEQIRQVHDDSDGTYGSPRVHRERSTCSSLAVRVAWVEDTQVWVRLLRRVASSRRT